MTQGPVVETNQDTALDAEIMARLCALAAFETAMGEADKVFKAGSAPKDQRGAVCAAMAAVHRLLVDTGMHTYVGPVVASAFALAALDEGVRLPLLKMEPRKRGRSKTANVVWVQRAVVAAALEQRFRQEGDLSVELSVAAAEVARWLAASEIFRDTKKSRAQAILDWRENVTGRLSHEEPKQVYSKYLKPASGAVGQYDVALRDKAALLRELKIWGIIEKR